MADYQTPADPVLAAQQRQAALEQYAAAQMQAARQQQAQQASNILGTYGGIKAMDALAGSGVASAAPSAVGALTASGAPAAMAPEAAEAIAGSPFYTAGIAGTPGEMAAAPAGAGGSLFLPAAGTIGAIDVLSHDYGPGRGALEGAASGAAIGSYFGAPGAAIGAGIGGVVGLGKGLLKHKTTKEYETERWNGLGKQGDWGGSAPEVSQLAASSHPAGDTGQNWTPEVASKAMQDPTQMWGTYGMLHAFGPDYFNNMSEFQRYAATKAAIDNGLLVQDHGDILVSDPEKLKSLLPSAYANKDYMAGYQTWKKANPVEIQPGGATQMNQTVGDGGAQFASIDKMMNDSLAGINKQAQADASKQKAASLAFQAAQPKGVPSMGGAPVKTGVESLDNILGSVMQ